MKTQVQGHTHCMTTRKPAIRAPGRQEKHALDSFLAHNGPEERGARDTLSLLQSLVERGSRLVISAPDLARDSKDSIEGPRRTLTDALVRIVCGIEERNEQVAPGEESV